MKLQKKLRNLVILIVVLLNVSCDQITKTIVREKISSNESIRFFNDHFTITKVENTGAFLSIGSSLPASVKIVILNILPVIVLLSGLCYLLIRRNISKVYIVAACCIIGGGIGNLYDRILYGSVTDFLHIDFVIFQTGIFNLADVSIMVGTALVLIESQRKTLGFQNPEHNLRS